MSTPAWSLEDIARLRELEADGKTITEIGRLMGKTRNAIAGIRRRLGLRRMPVVTPQQRIARRAARVQAATDQAIPKPAQLMYGNMLFVDAGTHNCMFPMGPPVGSRMEVCGKATLPGTAYCAGHHAKVYMPQGKPFDQGEITAPNPKKRRSVQIVVSDRLRVDARV